MTAINKSFFPSKTRCIPSDKIDINPVFAIPTAIAPKRIYDNAVSEFPAIPFMNIVIV